MQFSDLFRIKFCFLYFFCLHYCLINIHIFDYLESQLSGLSSPDNQGLTVLPKKKKKKKKMISCAQQFVKLTFLFFICPSNKMSQKIEFSLS